MANLGQLLQSQATFIAKWDKNSSVRQLLQIVQETNERNGGSFGNQLLDSTLSCLFKRQFTHRNSRKVETLLESKERRNHTPTTDGNAQLVSLRHNYLAVFLVLKFLFLKLLQNFLENIH